jgi:hypothetical protein
MCDQTCDIKLITINIQERRLLSRHIILRALIVGYIVEINGLLGSMNQFLEIKPLDSVGNISD